MEVDLKFLLQLFPLGDTTATASLFSALLWFSSRPPVWQPEHPSTNIFNFVGICESGKVL